MSRSPLRDAEARARLPARRHEPGGHHARLALRQPARWRRTTPTDSMGETGENVAERYGVSREDQDALRARVAPARGGRRRGRPLRRRDRDRRRSAAQGRPGDRRTPTRARAPTPRSRRLAKLRPVFREGGTVTAGNSSSINDGAACLVLGHRRSVRSGSGRSRWPASCRWRAAGVDPAYMGVGPIPASRKALERAGLAIDDIDLVELNEAFASQSLASRPRARHPAREAERERRRDRARSPARLLGRAPAHHARAGRCAGAAPATGWRRCASAWARASPPSSRIRPPDDGP